MRILIKKFKTYLIKIESLFFILCENCINYFLLPIGIFTVNINPTSHTLDHMSQYNDISKVTKELNHKLLSFESELYQQSEPSSERKLQLNSEIFKCINDVEKILKEKGDLSLISKKRLQVLKVTFGIAAMKSGDTDWESFLLSKEVFENNENFFRSDECLLNANDQIKQRVTMEERYNHWNSCQYNFAHNIAYNGMAAPYDQIKGDYYYYYLEEMNRCNIPKTIAIAAANARFAEDTCKRALQDEYQSTDILLNTLLKLNKFYNDYIDSYPNELDDSIRADGVSLVNGFSIFLPMEIKQKLDIN